MKGSLKLLSVFLAIFLLFTSGFIYEVAKDNPTSISLDKNFNYPIFNDKEVNAAKWLVDTTDSYPIYADYNGKLLLYGFVFFRVRSFFAELNELPSGAYVYLGSLNLKGFMMEVNKGKVELQNSRFYNNVITKKNRIYDNGYSEIFR